MRKMREKTIAVLLFGILALSFMGAFVSAEFALPPIKLVERNSATTVWTNSIHLKTTGDLPSGTNNWAVAEATIVIMMPSDFTLGDLETLSWYTYLVGGSTAHVDVILDLDSDGDYDNEDDALVIQYAYNDWDKHYLDHPNLEDPSYGALTGAWYQTFSDDGGGPAVIDNDAMAWATKGAAGAPPESPNFHFWSLGVWKAGVTYSTDGGSTTKTINEDSVILRLEIEVDNWGDNSEAFVDDIEINGFNIMSVTGPIGPAGSDGADGVDGATGPMGPRGLTGPRGATGLQGLSGLDGANGTNGPMGPQGPQGLEGLQGVSGEAGETGAQGSIGQTGPQGESGEQGPKGETGEQGSRGAIGLDGPQGESGPTTLIYTGVATGVISLLGVLYLIFGKKP